MSLMKSIGSSKIRVDAQSKVTGSAIYPGDIVMDDMLHMKILFAERCHARILSIDTTLAESAPGVVTVITAKDVPVNEYGLIMPDQPVLCGPGSDKEGVDIVRWEGDQIALIVAETEDQANHARDLVKVEWQDLTAYYSVNDAMAPDATPLHPDRENNTLVHWKIRRGDMAVGWDKSDVIIESEYITPAQEHAYLQPEAGVGFIDEQGRVTVRVAGQWTHEDQEQIAHALALPEEQVRVIYDAIGGAFGGREDMSVQIVLALAALRLNRPVKVVWTRQESIKGHHKRHPARIISRWGATKDGQLVAAESTILADAGAYAYTTTKVLGNANLMVTGPYYVPNVHVDTIGVYTNNPPGGAFRGFGGPQAAFAAESQMNKLAAALGMDPVAFRMKNLLDEEKTLPTGGPLPPVVSLDKVLSSCALEAGWKQLDDQWKLPKTDNTNPKVTRGIGIACSFKNVGFSFGFPENSWARVKIAGEGEIDQVILYQAGADCGQGAHTAMAQMVAEALQVPFDVVQVV
ncbi:MAG: molybdopterin cofactor-binding domain-containing protein, partial [Chloroflexota bacterium]